MDSARKFKKKDKIHRIEMLAKTPRYLIVKQRIRQAIGPYDDLLTMVREHKLRWYVQLTRSTAVAKTILQVTSTVQGERRRYGNATCGLDWSESENYKYKSKFSLKSVITWVTCKTGWEDRRERDDGPKRLWLETCIPLSSVGPWHFSFILPTKKRCRRKY